MDPDPYQGGPKTCGSLIFRELMFKDTENSAEKKTNSELTFAYIIKVPSNAGKIGTGNK